MMRPASWIVRLLLVCLVGVAAPGISQARENPDDQRSPATEPLQLDLGFQTGYDDNILQLSNSEIDVLEAEPGSDRFRIGSEDDLVNVGKLVLRWRIPHSGARRTILRGRVEAWKYLDNGIKNYEVFGARISQEVNRSSRHRSWAGGEYRRTPSRYSREVTDDDATASAGRRIRDSLAYGEDLLGVTYRQRILGRRLEASGALRVRDRDYDDDFNERDGVILDWMLRVRGRPWQGNRAEVGARLKWGAYDAEGDLPSTAIEDDDVSYEYTGVVLEASVPLLRRHEIGGTIELESRDYTTRKRADRARFGRKDDRMRLRASYEYEIKRDLSVWGAVQTKSVDASFPASAVGIDEETDYRETRITVGINWELTF